MSALLQSLVSWLLRLLPVNQPRPCEETLADWRSESAAARGTGRRFVVAVRALWSVARCVALISWRELRTRDGLSPLVRALAMASVVAAAFAWEQAVRMGDAGLSIGPTLAMLGSVGAVCVCMPLVAFVSGATGRRLVTPAPRMGPAIAISFLMLVTMGWLMPAASQTWREHMFNLTGGRGGLSPGLNERSLFDLVPMLFTSRFNQVLAVLNSRLFFVVATPVLLMTGVTSRSLIGSRRLFGSLLPIVIFLLPLATSRSAVPVLMWPALIGAVLVSRVLARPTNTQQALS